MPRDINIKPDVRGLDEAFQSELAAAKGTPGTLESVLGMGIGLPLKLAEQKKARGKRQALGEFSRTGKLPESFEPESAEESATLAKAGKEMRLGEDSELPGVLKSHVWAKFGDSARPEPEKMTGREASLLIAGRGMELRDKPPAPPKPPKDFRFVGDDGSVEPIPGGPADIKQRAADEKSERATRAVVTQSDRVTATVDRAIQNVSGWTAGFGSKLSGIPTTGAKNLASDLQTIKANLGFAELQAMRQASPTGGALGNVSDLEINALQATVGSLDQAQSPEQLRARLNDIKIHYANWKNAVMQDAAERGQRGGQPPEQRQAPQRQGAPPPAQKGSETAEQIRARRAQRGK